MKFNLTALGYDITQPQGDIVEFNLSIYDCDYYWPLVPINLSANRVWWQGPWGNSPGYNEVRIYAKPSVTVNTNPLPYLAPEVVVPNGKLFPSPNIDGLLTDAVWANAASVNLKYGDDATRNAYPGVLKWRGGQFQPVVNGGQAAVLDPADATVKYFFRDDSLFFGFDARDAVVQSIAGDRMDGFVVGIYDRGAREPLDNTLQPRRLTFYVSPTGTATTADYLTTLVGNGGARVKLVLKPGTTVDTLGTNIDTGYTAEMVVDLTKLGYPHGLGDGLLFFIIDYYDGDSFIPFTDSYATHVWWGGEYENTCCPAWSFMDPNLNVLTGVPESGPGTTGYQVVNAAPNPFRSSTTLHYSLAAQGRVELTVYDAQGRVVQRRDLGVQGAGEQHSPFVGFNGRTGVYLYRLRITDPVTGGEQAALDGRFLVVR